MVREPVDDPAAVQKLQDVRSSTMFLNYDLLARRWVPYGFVYPFGEAAAGILTAGALTRLSAPLALFMAQSARSVFKAVYIDKRELKCACVGGQQCAARLCLADRKSVHDRNGSVDGREASRMITALLLSVFLFLRRRFAPCHSGVGHWLSTGAAIRRQSAVSLLVLASFPRGDPFCRRFLAGRAMGPGGFDKAPSMDWMDYFYFSLINVTTLGLGDIYPTEHLRVLAGVEALTGFALITARRSYLDHDAQRRKSMTEKTTHSDKGGAAATGIHGHGVDLDRDHVLPDVCQHLYRR